MAKDRTGSGAEQITLAVLGRVQDCFESLVGGSGHLASYSVEAGSFQIEKAEPRASGHVEYFFAARAQYESEFTVYDDNTPPDIHGVAGSIVLTPDFELVFDDKGDVLFAPYKSLVGKL